MPVPRRTVGDTSHPAGPYGWTGHRLLPDRAGTVVQCQSRLSGVNQPSGLRLKEGRPTLLAEVGLGASHSSSSLVLAVEDPAVYCPRTSQSPIREVDPELRNWLLKALSDGFVQTVLLPLILLGIAFVAELAASKRPWTRNDATVGFDLLFAAAGSHLAVLGGANGLSREDAYVRVDVGYAIGIDMRFAILTGLMLAIIGLIVWIRLRGTDTSDNLKLYEGVIIPATVGFGALVVIYWLDFNILGAS
jgi:hypothetical protein